LKTDNIFILLTIDLYGESNLHKCLSLILTRQTALSLFCNATISS